MRTNLLWIPLSLLFVQYPPEMVQAEEWIVQRDSHAEIKVLNLKKYAFETSPKRISLQGKSASVTLVLKSDAASALEKMGNLRFRVFQGTADELARKPFMYIEKEDCNVYFSTLKDTKVFLSELSGFAVNEYWLQINEHGLTDQTWVLVLEEAGGDQADVVKIKRKSAPAYFASGFQITLSPQRTFSPQEIQDVIAWSRKTPPMPALEGAICFDGTPNTIADSEPGDHETVRLVAIECAAARGVS